VALAVIGIDVFHLRSNLAHIVIRKLLNSGSGNPSSNKISPRHAGNGKFLAPKLIQWILSLSKLSKLQQNIGCQPSKHFYYLSLGTSMMMATTMCEWCKSLDCQDMLNEKNTRTKTNYAGTSEGAQAL
jgi:hypothetical protein